MSRNWLTQSGAGPTGHARWTKRRKAQRSLATHPYIGAISPDHTGFRQHTLSGYRLLYQMHPDTADEATAGDIFLAAFLRPGQP